LSGSSDLYGPDKRSPYNSINFVTCHDGFTLRDLFSYEKKNNFDNGENNLDGSNYNYSFNCGSEGETKNINVVNLRRQMIKNALCSLFFSLGTPMLMNGDEFMRTQKGNNNAYCQDNEISWINWKYLQQNSDLVDFCKNAIAFRKAHAVLKGRKFFTGKDTNGDNIPDVLWYGKNLDQPAWDDPEQRTLCYQLDARENQGNPSNYCLFFIFNADQNPQTIKLPTHAGWKWYRVVDTSRPSGEDFLKAGAEEILSQVEFYQANPRSVVVLLAK
jgi:isoamylase